MPGIELKLTDDQMREALSAALLAQMTDGMRADVLKQVITYLTTVTGDGYGRRNVSPVQEAFTTAARVAVNRMMIEYLEENAEAQAALRRMVEEAVADAMTQRPRLRELVADALVSVLANRD